MRYFLGAAGSRARMVRDYLGERLRCGAPVLTGDPARGTVFLLDGVGGMQLAPLLARAAFRQAGLPFATYLFDWHRGLRGEMLADLMCRRANLRRALELARVIRRFRREHPGAPLHLLSHSGGAGLAVFAAERLGQRTRLDTLILGAPALSPGYPLAEALRHVRKCYAFVSRRDRFILGLGTAVFGTVDRRFCRAAGLAGFAPLDDRPGNGELAGRLRQIEWTPEMTAEDHFGHHTGATTIAFIRRYVVPLLAPDGDVPGTRLDDPAESGTLTSSERH